MRDALRSDFRHYQETCFSSFTASGEDNIGAWTVVAFLREVEDRRIMTRTQAPRRDGGRQPLRQRITRKIQHYPRFDAIDRGVGESGWKFVALLRLSPAVPFTLQNYCAIRVRIHREQVSNRESMAAWHRRRVLPGRRVSCPAGKRNPRCRCSAGCARLQRC